MNAATEAAPVNLEALDFDLACQIEHWYVFMPEQAKPACGKPAAYTATIHNFHTCAAVEKFVCAECINELKTPCYTCHQPRVSDVRPIRPQT